MGRNRENYNRYCREYYKTHKKQYLAKAKKRHEANKAWFEERFKDILHCSKCPETDRCCMEFHHLNPKEKEYQIAHMIRTHSKEKIEKEVAKCIVVCANCHRKIHFVSVAEK